MNEQDLDQMDELLSRGARGEDVGPPQEWCESTLAGMREWRGHYDVVAPGPKGAFPDMTMLVRFAMPLHVTSKGE